MTDVLIKRELLPCPFCGGEAELTQFTRKRWSVDCGACEAAMISCANRQDAVDNWNTRAAPRQPEGDDPPVVAVVLTEEQMGIGYDRRMGPVVWIGTPPTGAHMMTVSQHQRAIAELRQQVEDLELHLASTEEDLESAGRNASAFENRMGELQVENGNLQAERDTLRQQLAERDAEVESLKERLSSRAAEHCDDLADKIELEVQRDKLAGLLRELRETTGEYAWDADLEQRIDAALAEVNK